MPSFDHGFLLRRAQARRARRRSRASGWSTRCCWRGASIRPGPNRLDALCARYGIDNSRRTKHGALLDAEILAEVYLELIGARQAQLGLAESGVRRGRGGDGAVARRERAVALAPRISDADRAAHREFVASLGENALWRNYLPDGA